VIRGERCVCWWTLMDGFRDYYNFLRPHMGIEGLTPPDAAGIALELCRNRIKDLKKQSNAKIPFALSSF